MITIILVTIITINNNNNNFYLVFVIHGDVSRLRKATRSLRIESQ